MPVKSPYIIVLDRSPLLEPSGWKPRLDQLLRTHCAIEQLLISPRRDGRIVFSGRGKQFIDSEVTHARLNALAALETYRLLVPSQVLLEEWSLDTIGNLVFLRLLLHSEWMSGARGILVTSEYHLKRVLMIARHVFGQLFTQLTFVHSQNPSNEPLDQLIQNEAISMLYANALVSQTKQLEDILYWMATEHKLYHGYLGAAQFAALWDTGLNKCAG